MKKTKKILYSIIPSVIIVLTMIHLITFHGIFESSHFIILNLLFIIQIILLYIEMGNYELTTSKKFLYTFGLLAFIPFHYILVWGILPAGAPPAED